MKKKFLTFFAILTAIYCINLLVYLKNLDRIKDPRPLNTKRGKALFADKAIFNPKCGCHKFSINFKDIKKSMWRVKLTNRVF